MGTIRFSNQAAIAQSVHGTHGVRSLAVEEKIEERTVYPILILSRSAFGPDVETGLASGVFVCFCDEACSGKSDQRSWTARGVGWVGAYGGGAGETGGGKGGCVLAGLHVFCLHPSLRFCVSVGFPLPVLYLSISYALAPLWLSFRFPLAFL